MATIFFNPTQELNRILPLAKNRLDKARVRAIGLRDLSLRNEQLNECAVEMFRTDARFAMRFYVHWSDLWRSDLLDQTNLWEDYNELYNGLASLEEEYQWINNKLFGTDDDREISLQSSLEFTLPPKVLPDSCPSSPLCFENHIEPKKQTPFTDHRSRKSIKVKRNRFHFLSFHRIFTATAC